MNNSIIWFGIFLGTVIGIGLCYYISIKSRELKSHRHQQQLLAAEHESKKTFLIDSIKVLATTILDDQVELSEGSIRIKVLIDHLDASLHEKAEFKVFEDMYLAMQHMPTHQARKDTDKHFIHKLDQQRFSLEQKHRNEIRTAAKALLDYLSA